MNRKSLVRELFCTRDTTNRLPFTIQGRIILDGGGAREERTQISDIHKTLLIKYIR